MAIRTSIAPLPHPSRGRVAPPPAVGPTASVIRATPVQASDSVVEVDAEFLEFVGDGEPDPGASLEELDALFLEEDPCAASVVAAPAPTITAALIETLPAHAPTAAPIVAPAMPVAPSPRLAAAPIAFAPAPTVTATPVASAPVVASTAAHASAPTVVAHAVAVVRPHVHPSRPTRAESSTVASVSSGSLIAAARGRWPWWRYTALSAGLSALVVTLAMVGRSDRAEAASSSAELDAVELRYDPALVAQAAIVPIASPVVTPSEPPRVLARRVALRGQRNLAAGLPRLARAAFEEALQLDPRNRAALAGLGRLEFEAGRFTDAIDHLERALQLEPRDRELRSMLAQAHEAKGHGRSAARHARLAASP